MDKILVLDFGGLLNNIGRNYTKLGYNIIVVNADNRDIPRIQVNTDVLNFTLKQIPFSLVSLLTVSAG